MMTAFAILLLIIPPLLQFLFMTRPTFDCQFGPSLQNGFGNAESAFEVLSWMDGMGWESHHSLAVVKC